MNRSKTQKNSYFKIHTWLIKEYGKAIKCDNPDCKKNSSRYEWALKKGYEYIKDINNFMQLCVPCHRKYDITEESRLAMSIANKGNKHPQRSLPVTQFSLTGEKIAEYHSLYLAGKSTGVHRIAIGRCLSGKSLTAGGFIWKHNKKMKKYYEKSIKNKLKKPQREEIALMWAASNIYNINAESLEYDTNLEDKEAIANMCKDLAIKLLNGRPLIPSFAAIVKYISEKANPLKYEQETKPQLHPIFQEIVNKFLK